jgi:hypothetical protein
LLEVVRHDACRGLEMGRMRMVACAQSYPIYLIAIGPPCAIVLQRRLDGARCVVDVIVFGISALPDL